MWEWWYEPTIAEYSPSVSSDNLIVVVASKLRGVLTEWSCKDSIGATVEIALASVLNDECDM